MYLALENLKNSISLKWNEERIIDKFEEEIQTDNQFYPSNYILELQAVKTMYDYHNNINDTSNKRVCTNCFIVADELDAQISYYRKVYQILRKFVDNRLIHLGHLIQSQNDNIESLANSLLTENQIALNNASNWYEQSGRNILTNLERDYKAFVKNVFGVTLNTLKDYIHALSRINHQYDLHRKISRIKNFWTCLINSSESFNNNLSKIEELQNEFSAFKPSSYSSNDLVNHYDALISQLKVLSNNDIAKSCCKKNNGNCVAIMLADNKKWYTLSGLDDTNVLAESKNKIYDLSQKLSMPGFEYARLTGNVTRYTIYSTNHPFIEYPITLSQDTDSDTQGKEYSCCERKLLAMEPNAQHYNFFIKYKPCKRCLPAMAHGNIISNIYATEKGFYDQNETIKTIIVKELGNRTFRICEHFDIEKDY